ncbi:hypothetical protein ACHAWF_010783, partial [Thalassiosira exigua]
KGADDPCLYRGKNFVFDPRRTDPVAGSGVATLGSDHRASVVGKCVLCAAPHDDYGNGRRRLEEEPVHQSGQTAPSRCMPLCSIAPRSCPMTQVSPPMRAVSTLEVFYEDKTSNSAVLFMTVRQGHKNRPWPRKMEDVSAKDLLALIGTLHDTLDNW